MSDLLLERIDRLLGHPSTDPHGDPIPGPDGSWTPPPEALLLADARPGSYRVLRVADSAPQRLVRLRKAGLVPGALLELLPGQQPRIRVGGADRRLGAEDLAALRVVPA